MNKFTLSLLIYFKIMNVLIFVFIIAQSDLLVQSKNTKCSSDDFSSSISKLEKLERSTFGLLLFHRHSVFRAVMAIFLETYYVVQKMLAHSVDVSKCMSSVRKNKIINLEKVDADAARCLEKFMATLKKILDERKDKQEACGSPTSKYYNLLVEPTGKIHEPTLKKITSFLEDMPSCMKNLSTTYKKNTEHVVKLAKSCTKNTKKPEEWLKKLKGAVSKLQDIGTSDNSLIKFRDLFKIIVDDYNYKTRLSIKGIAQKVYDKVNNHNGKLRKEVCEPSLKFKMIKLVAKTESQLKTCLRQQFQPSESILFDVEGEIFAMSSIVNFYEDKIKTCMTMSCTRNIIYRYFEARLRFPFIVKALGVVPHGLLNVSMCITNSFREFEKESVEAGKVAMEVC